MGSRLKVFAGIFIHVGRSQQAINAALSRERNGTDRRCICAIGGIDDLLAGGVEEAAIEGFEPDANFLLLNRCHDFTKIDGDKRTNISSQPQRLTADVNQLNKQKTT